MQVHCRLRGIMDERGIKVEELHRMSGVGREAISALRGRNWQRVSGVVMGRLCATLDITPNDLFVLNPEDIWAPIKLGGELTIHYGSRSFEETQHGPDAADESVLTGQYVGVWDMRAYKLITEFLKQSRLEVSVSLQEHITGRERGYDPAVRKAVRQIFERGNHILIGSPIACQFAEEVVCHAYGVRPYTPEKREAFPYGFVWDWRRGARRRSAGRASEESSASSRTSGQAGGETHHGESGQGAGLCPDSRLPHLQSTDPPRARE